VAFTEVFAGIPVADYEAARAWYERLLGRPPDFFPNDHEAVWGLTEHGWIYVVRDAERAGQALVTFLVDDLEAHVPDPGAIEVWADGLRRVELTDPEGNRIQFAQPP
jgi:catechol 2,3-dioxygenase-like lactoylglutathione lyase family enzyme